MKAVYTKPKSLREKEFHFCPGCHHGIIHKLVAEAIDFYDLREKTIGVASVGCSVFLYDYFNVDVVEAPHGRAAAVATGVKRVKEDNFVFTYQGDGDLAAIGTAEIIHAANRGEMITVIFVNNAIYGMTGGQMAPTTLLGQKTTTSPFGRDFTRDGYPIKMAEMLSTLEGVCFSARCAVDKISNLRKTKKAILKAFEMQIKGIGFSFVEILSACPTNWGVSPLEANKKIEEEMIPYYPLGIFKEKNTKDEL
jgi:2-oxoglutarate ferredoxin oxidoreductase subunit beta